ncbi:MAG: hypothetical protein A2X87_08490 [Deltaproteobacteria bacterium GWC2_42_51]|nr:MAG: hypothetical protein A2056_05450 [Deltaproteobacteria bacterium GWA2_42_85]OGP35418.1 MAG: hypothetical protein A2X87_08490 [Deltaproteobacteria bacterium GWC2_42_51]OGP41528.1 MAG: hypothetical protein A2090_05210 [Deltaproteobacteria bacterium GWD2_42_10]OGP48360.1 MAG: hypothetical protein A2022_10205 [Deltaproteobacteria bacterium GWF2_42_12]OGQ25118.1 MAG: hypothetical protein A3D29_01650 [Deltaproteobacteria bacterium RIFCSPHIGHO2_02_FULL_42_44]OGQ37122.1 MAG: hypothetical protei
MRRIIKLCIAAFVGLMVFSCIPVRLSYPVLNPEDFSKEIARLESIIQAENDLSKVTKAHQQLAVLYLHYKNPNPDYVNAIKHLEIYVTLSQRGGKTEEVQSLLSLLRAFNENKLLGHESKNRIDQLIKENQELKKTVEQLQSLDIKMEEKRREVK